VDVLERLYRLLDGLKPGAVLMVTSQKLPSPLFELVSEGTYEASWGSVTARVYRRQALPKWAARVVTKHY
jgi:hypothetical protein